jgi:large subunit ribosomal protein L4
MEVSVYNIKGEDTGKKIELNDAIFGIEPNDHVIYLAVKQYLAAQRQGTHKSKERSEITGSTRKLIRQKGGGGARRGDIKSPVLRGGGRVFGPRPRDYWFKLNKKVKNLARKGALSYKAQQNAINNIIAGGSRPVENGVSSQSAAVAKTDPSTFTSQDFKNIRERVRRGEKIVL